MFRKLSDHPSNAEYYMYFEMIRLLPEPKRTCDSENVRLDVLSLCSSLNLK